MTFLYHVGDHIFVHTKLMKDELIRQLDVQEERVTVIPFRLNNTVRETTIDTPKARQLLNIGIEDIRLRLFGNVVPHKGLDILIEALENVLENKKSKTDHRRKYRG